VTTDQLDQLINFVALGGPGNASAMVMATSVRNGGIALVIVTAVFTAISAVASGNGSRFRPSS
jgi:hypothetical protein